VTEEQYDPVLKTQELTKPKIISRFYSKVDVVNSNGVYQLQLDQRKAKTPKKNSLEFKNKFLAEAIAKEWQDQNKNIDPFSMPINRICNVALDIEEHLVPEVVLELLGYIQTDTIIFRSDQPEGLVQLQERHWDPVHMKAQKLLGAPIILTQTLDIPEQSDAIKVNVKKIFPLFSTPPEIMMCICADSH